MSEQTTEVARDEQVEYRDIQGFPGYRVGNDGSVWSCRQREPGRGRYSLTGADKWRRLAANPNKQGYILVTLHRGGIASGGARPWYTQTHPLILTAFAGPRPVGMEACHNNGIPSDNRLSNLRWDTPKGNAADRVHHGTTNRGERCPFHKLKLTQVVAIKTMLRDGANKRTIRERFCISEATVNDIEKGRSWKHVEVASDRCLES